jgi:signal transduction histidine kinase
MVINLKAAKDNQRLAVLCTYPLAACGAYEILDVVRTHQFALARRHGSWDLIETAGHKQAKAEIKRLNEELEQRVVERTSQLLLASEALREAQTALAHVNRVATMGQLAASIAHEIKQPLAGAITNAEAGLGWLARQPPNVEKACNSLAHHDRPPFSGRPSLTGHCGHCWTCSLPHPVAIDVSFP